MIRNSALVFVLQFRHIVRIENAGAAHTGAFAFDPRIVYDPFSQRFFASDWRRLSSRRSRWASSRCSFV